MSIIISKKETALDTKKVFVVHGRNEKARKAMFSFLRAVGLEPIEWSEAISLTGKASPHISEILDCAFKKAQAVIVLITGDDLAQLHPAYLKDDDPAYERKPFPQARPNVLFEAGLAFGSHPDRTILVELGKSRPFSDTAGRHTIRISKEPETRNIFASKLKTAGCSVSTDTKNDWLTEGDFEGALLEETSLPEEKVVSGETVVEEKVLIEKDDGLHKDAIHVLICIAHSYQRELSADRIINMMEISPTKTLYYMDLLISKVYLKGRKHVKGDDTYFLTQKARAYLVENDLV